MGEARADVANYIRPLLVGLGYGGLGLLSLSVTRFGASVESIWFSNALVVWALVTAAPRTWPMYVAWATLGHVGAHLLANDALDLTLAFAVGDMFECVLAAALLRMRPRALAFEDRASTFYFLVCGIVAPFASALVAWGATYAFTGAALSTRDVTVWFCVDTLGLLVVLPIIHAIGQGRWGALRAQWRRVLLGVLAIVGVAWASVAFDMPLLRLLFLPMFVIIAFELGVAGVQLALGVTMLSWIATVYAGAPPQLFGDVDMRDSLLLVQFLTVIFTASYLPLAVVIEEKQRLNDVLSETLTETREAWGAIIGAEARYRLVVDNISETVMRVQPGGLILFASPGCEALLHADRKFEGRNLLDLMHPEDRERIVERVRQTVAEGLFNLAQRWRMRIHGDDDAWYAVDARVTPVKVGKRDGEHEFIVVLRSTETNGA